MSNYSIIVEGKFQEGYELHFSEYSNVVRKYLNKHGGVVIRRQKIAKTLYGNRAPDLLMLIDFPTREVAESIFFAQEYLDIIPLREKIFKEFNMYLAPNEEI